MYSQKYTYKKGSSLFYAFSCNLDAIPKNI